MFRRHALAPIIAATLAAVTMASCGSDQAAPSAGADAEPGERAASFDATLEAARGQTVRWWLYGGDDKVNAYVDEQVAPAARKLGVTIKRVPITDTADAVQRVVAQRRAGRTSGGAVDLIWINGENFAAGKEAQLWKRDWAQALPNASFLDAADPAIATDFQVPVDGQESPWQRAAFVFAHDQARVQAPPTSFNALLAYAKRHPGRVTYPAPPDFTGSAFVRQLVASKGEDGAFAYLEELTPSLYRRGQTYPESEAELSRLFGDGQVDLAMSYDPSFVNSAVRKGTFPSTARPFVLDEGTLQNTSFVTIPADATNAAGAQVVADLLLSPELQAEKADPESLGNPTVLALDRLEPAQRERFSQATRSPFILERYGTTIPELPASDVAPLEQRWRDEILRAAQ